MYLVTRTASFSKLFFMLSFCGLVMYLVLAFYTFHLAYTSVTKADHIQTSFVTFPDIDVKKKAKHLQKNIKYILLWTIPDFKYNVQTEGTKLLKDNNCDFSNCYITTQKKLLHSIDKFDAIVFSINTLRKWKHYLPKERSVKQKYVFYSMIPAGCYPVCNVMADDYFNWTWTYKLYSDVVTPLFEVKDLKGKIVAPYLEVEWPEKLASFSTQKRKPKALMWYVENCDSVHSNMYARDLQMYMNDHSLELDIYGCGNKACPKEGCLSLLNKDYSFYLAIEENKSDDYVSDAVLQGMRNNAVPVVIGGADYTKYLPPGSYIDARYESPERLASFLEYILRNPASYSSYFAWKYNYTINEASIQKGYCQLCALLNNKERVNSYSSYTTFRKWWYNGNLQEKCYPKGAESMDAVLSYIDNPVVLKKYLP